MENKKDAAAKSAKIESRVVLDCLDFDILIVSKDFQILFANKAFLKKNGLSYDEVVGHFCYQISHHLDSRCQPPHDPCPIETVMKGGASAVEVHTHTDKEGKKNLVNVVAAKISGEKEEAGFLHISLPVKEGAKNEESTQQALEKTMDVLNAVNLYQDQMEETENKKQQLEKAKGVLEQRVSELETLNRIVVGRELKMVELKKRLDDMEGSRLAE